MIAAVHQPQYLPWLGYFDKIDKADIFVLLDTVQFKKNEWQNRNKIKTGSTNTGKPFCQTIKGHRISTRWRTYWETFSLPPGTISLS